MAKKKLIRGTIRIDGRLIQATFATKSDRAEWYIKMRQQKMRAKAGLETEFEATPIENVAADFIVSRMDNETWKHDKYRIEHYFLSEDRFLGRMIHSITRKEWKQAFDELVTVHNLKPKTVNNIRTTISCLYDYAIKDEPKRAQFNPIAEIRPLPVIEASIEFFKTKQEIQKYLTHAQALNPMFGMFAYVAVNTGMREGEIISLHNECVDLKNKTIHIKRKWSHSRRIIVPGTKNKRERVIGINKTLAGAFKRHLTWTPFRAPSDLVVCNRSGRPLESKHLQEMHAKVIRAAKLHYIVIHGLRHTFATQFLANGGNIWTLKNILGHRSIKTTERYSHAIPVKIQAQAGVFEVGAR